jgi:dTDP-4-dehydrorhamnose 3,5-epimerase
MNIERTTIDGLWLLRTQPVCDARGSLTRLYCAEALAEVAPELRFVQTNHTLTHRRGSVRGLHVQRAPALEYKLVRCLRGSVFDVAADLRHGSASFGRCFGVELRGDVQLLIPPGVAHGFQTLDDQVEMLYQHSAAYSPLHEIGVRHDDPHLAIRWPLPVTEVSARDRTLPLLDDRFAPLHT